MLIKENSPPWLHTGFSSLLPTTLFYIKQGSSFRASFLGIEILFLLFQHMLSFKHSLLPLKIRNAVRGRSSNQCSRFRFAWKHKSHNRNKPMLPPPGKHAVMETHLIPTICFSIVFPSYPPSLKSLTSFALLSPCNSPILHPIHTYLPFQANNFIEIVKIFQTAK